MRFIIAMAVFACACSAGATKPQSKKAPVKPPVVSPEKLFDDARHAIDDGDLKLGRKLFLQLQQTHGHELISRVREGDEIEIGGGVPGVTYGDLAAKEIAYIDAELSTGKKRIFKSGAESLTALVEAIDTNQGDVLGGKMWVRMNWGQCDEDRHESPPDEALRELRKHIGKKVIKQKEIRADSGREAVALVRFKSNRYLKIELSRYKTGWIWNHFTLCGRAF